MMQKVSDCTSPPARQLAQQPTHQKGMPPVERFARAVVLWGRVAGKLLFCVGYLPVLFVRASVRQHAFLVAMTEKLVQAGMHEEDAKQLAGEWKLKKVLK